MPRAFKATEGIAMSRTRRCCPIWVGVADIGDQDVVGCKLEHMCRNVVTILNPMCLEVGYPKIISAESDSEFVSIEMDLRANLRSGVLDLSGPRRSTDSGYIA